MHDFDFLGAGAQIGLLAAVILLAAVECGRSEGSPPEPVQTILVLGDSLAAGYGLEPSEAFPALLQEKIEANGWSFKVVNAGVSGDTTAGGLRRLNWLLRQKVDVLVLELGGNDGLRGIPPSTTRSNLQAIISRTREKYPAVQVVVAGMRMPTNWGASYVQEFESIFPAVAKEHNAALVPFLLEGLGGVRELNQPDRIHPTAEGQKVIADNVWRVLEPLLGGKGSKDRPGG
jgi:acyl-CoA thioesterase-1